jgi:hypothetical protein
MIRNQSKFGIPGKRIVPFGAVLFLLFLSASAEAQERESVFIAPLGEVLLYSEQSASYGGGFTLGWGGKFSAGLRVLYALDNDEVAVLECCLFFRYGLSRRPDRAGPFIQLNAGSALFFKNDPITIPARAGIFSAGLAFGWRFMLGKRWYVEPSVRGGYPYLAGGGLSAGFWF